jgi:hypothetical protein
MSEKKKSLWKVMKCPLAVVTGAVLGGLGGAGVGSLFPVIGTVGLGIIGGAFGAVNGAATTC